MLGTYFAVAVMVIYIFLNTLIFLPILFFLDEKKGVKITGIIKKSYGRFTVWLTGSTVEVKYKNFESFKRIANKEPVVVIANHQSFVDIPLLLGYLDINIGFVAKEEIRRWYLFNLWMERAQCVFLDRSSPKKALNSFSKAVQFIRDGKSVCVFPEGSRTRDGKVGEFKRGSFKLALESGVKVLPITIDGTYDVMNKNKFYIQRRKKILLTIGEIIDIKKIDKFELKEINGRIREEIIMEMKSV